MTGIGALTTWKDSRVFQRSKQVSSSCPCTGSGTVSMELSQATWKREKPGTPPLSVSRTVTLLSLGFFVLLRFAPRERPHN